MGSTHNLCFEQKYENSKKKNPLKTVIFTAVKNRCISQGRVFVKGTGETVGSSEVFFFLRTYSQVSKLVKRFFRI